MKAMNEFEKTIQSYLDRFAGNDAVFAGKYQAAKSTIEKSITKCCEYIYDWVQKQKRPGFTDDEIYGQAVHFYDEQALNAPGNVGTHPSVVVNHVVELTEEEREEARIRVRKAFEQQELARIKAEDEKTRQKAEKKAEKDKRKAEAKRDKQSAGMMDLFGI